MRSAAWVLALGVALAALPVAAQQTPADVVDAFHFALKGGKRQQALELLTSDVLVFEQGRVERSRTEYARRHLADDIAFASATRRTVSRRSSRLQGNTAWVASVNRNRGKIDNRSVDFTTDETMVLMRIAGKWRIAHIHWSFDDKMAHD